mgnify:CR=1 FL=1
MAVGLLLSNATRRRGCQHLLTEALAGSPRRPGAVRGGRPSSGAVRGGQSLEEAARAEGLTLERTGVLQRRPDGYVPGLGPAQDLMAVAFTLQPGESSDQVFDLASKLALVQVLERTEAQRRAKEKKASCLSRPSPAATTAQRSAGAPYEEPTTVSPGAGHPRRTTPAARRHSPTVSRAAMNEPRSAQMCWAASFQHRLSQNKCQLPPFDSRACRRSC